MRLQFLSRSGVGCEVPDHPITLGDKNNTPPWTGGTHNENGGLEKLSSRRLHRRIARRIQYGPPRCAFLGRVSWAYVRYKLLVNILARSISRLILAVYYYYLQVHTVPVLSPIDSPWGSLRVAADGCNRCVCEWSRRKKKTRNKTRNKNMFVHGARLIYTYE